MLDSWLPHKSRHEPKPVPLFPNEPVTKLEDEIPPNSLRSLSDKFTTPHDSALAALYGKSPDTVDSLNLQSDTPELDAYDRDAMYAPRVELVNDPFDGSVVGNLVRPDPHTHHEAYVPLSDAANKNEELWSHLSSVLDLQNQIAAFHLDMEGIGSRADGKGKAKGKTNSRTPVASSRPPPTRLASTSLGDPEYVGEDEGVGVGAEDDEEDRKDRELEEEFARLADQFEGRKEGINEIMSKLDELSKALTQFHALQAPEILFPTSKHNSISVSASPLSVVDGQGAFPLTASPSATLSRNDSVSPAGILSPTRMVKSPIPAESYEL